MISLASVSIPSERNSKEGGFVVFTILLATLILISQGGQNAGEGSIAWSVQIQQASRDLQLFRLHLASYMRPCVFSLKRNFRYV